MNKIRMINNKACLEKFTHRVLRIAASFAFIWGIITVHIREYILERVQKFLKNIVTYKISYFLITGSMFIIYVIHKNHSCTLNLQRDTGYFTPIVSLPLKVYCFIPRI